MGNEHEQAPGKSSSPFDIIQNLQAIFASVLNQTGAAGTTGELPAPGPADKQAQTQPDWKMREANDFMHYAWMSGDPHVIDAARKRMKELGGDPGPDVSEVGQRRAWEEKYGAQHDALVAKFHDAYSADDAEALAKVKAQLAAMPPQPM